ncbi:TetR/AcrR family transcriptional regulator [Demequina sp. NBRC 110053]|uniref:TetR/AcrR family transcriptional regulator n=1 Tax=Demequina sp. NBRC 110053 TaxID=1570342 RepID=UPI0009FF6D39|nr:TetR/AcrR family transcriptional regulator [Demequina sp. NBRC 110053]
MAAETTGRDRIVDVALRLFAQRGHDAVSVRDIAAEGKVSVGLIAHHFGSKEGLRREVDAHVIGLFDDLTDTAVEASPGPSGAIADSFASLLLGQLPPASPIPAYLRRLVLSGDPAGRALVERWHALSVALLDRMTAAGAARATADPEATAAFLMVNDLAMILMHEHIASAIGADPLGRDGAQRWAAAAVDAYTHGIFTPPEETP